MYDIVSDLPFFFSGVESSKAHGFTASLTIRIPLVDYRIIYNAQEPDRVAEHRNQPLSSNPLKSWNVFPFYFFRDLFFPGETLDHLLPTWAVSLRVGRRAQECKQQRSNLIHDFDDIRPNFSLLEGDKPHSPPFFDQFFSFSKIA
jgi:hypothetical protein